MADPVTTTALILTPEVVVALVELINILLERSGTKSDFRDNLTAVKLDLGVVNDVLQEIQRKKRRKLPKGVRAWKDEATLIVEEAQEFVTRIDNNNNNRRATHNFPLFRNGKELRYNDKDARQLESLKKRLGDVTKHNPTVIALLRASRCFPL